MRLKFTALPANTSRSNPLLAILYLSEPELERTWELQT